MGRRLGYGVAFLVGSWAILSSVGCGSSGPSGTPSGAGGARFDGGTDPSSAGGADAGSTSGAGGAGGMAGAPDAGSGGSGGLSCSDLFPPTLQTYSIDI